MDDSEAIDVQGMSAPVAGACVKRGCHYAGFLEQATGYTNAKAEIARLRALLERQHRYQLNNGQPNYLNTQLGVDTKAALAISD